MDQGNLAGAKKNAQRQGALIVFADESGLSQKPPIRQTWAPKGKTPVITHSFSWKKLSMNAALVYHWDGAPVNLYFEIIPGSYDQHRLVDFIDTLRHELRDHPMILVWDGLPAHKTNLVKDYLAQHPHISRVPSSFHPLSQERHGRG